MFHFRRVNPDVLTSRVTHGITSQWEIQLEILVLNFINFWLLRRLERKRDEEKKSVRGRKFFYLLGRYYLRDRDGFIKIKERGQAVFFQDLETSK